jgi:hypothetical protein
MHTPVKTRFAFLLCFAITGAVALLLGVAAAAFAQSPVPGLPPDVGAYLEGLNLTQDGANAAENKLKTVPDDAISHCKLIPYYFFHEESRINWQKHLFWLIDHHPESEVFDTPAPVTYMVRTNASQLPSSEQLLEFKRHWEQAAAAHPGNAAVLLHTASAFSGQVLNSTTDVSAQDYGLGFAYARKAVEADNKCVRCRNMLGSFIGRGILGFPPTMQANWTCVPKTPVMVKMMSDLRKEIESSTDPEIIVAAGESITGFASVYGSHCGGNIADADAYGMKLLRRATSLDPSLIESHYLKNKLKSAR